MTLDEIISAKLDALEEVPEDFIAVVNKQNEGLFNILIKLLGELERDGDRILLTDGNIQKINAINETLQDTLFQDDYVSALKNFVKQFDTQAASINKVFDLQFKKFSEKDLYNSVLKQSQKSTLLFLDGDAIGRAVFKPLEDKLLTSVYSGSSFSEMVSTMKDYILGNSELDPKLTSYVKRYARDSFAIFDRTYTNIISQDMDVEYFEYSGGTLKDTRDFCAARVGNVYTKDEIESWASEDWQGKNPSTDSATIFSYCGGYNCIHSLIARDKNFIDIESVNQYN